MRIKFLIFFLVAYFHGYTQKFVQESVYHEFGFALGGNHIIGDWIEYNNFTNIAQLTGIGISGINRINIKDKNISFKNYATLSFSKNSYTMDFNRYSIWHNLENKEKSALYSDSYLFILGSQIEYDFFNANIYRDINKEVKINPYLGLGLGLVGYYSTISTSSPSRNLPDILKYNYDNFDSKLGLSLFFNVSIGTKFKLTKRGTINIQLSYYYTFTDNIDWLNSVSNNDYIQEIQIGYTYVF